MDYALSQRIPKLLSIILTGVCISISTTIFQTITGNKILTLMLWDLIHYICINTNSNSICLREFKCIYSKQKI